MTLFIASCLPFLHKQNTVLFLVVILCYSRNGINGITRRSISTELRQLYVTKNILNLSWELSLRVFLRKIKKTTPFLISIMMLSQNILRFPFFNKHQWISFFNFWSQMKAWSISCAKYQYKGDYQPVYKTFF